MASTVGSSNIPMTGMSNCNGAQDYYCDCCNQEMEAEISLNQFYIPTSGLRGRASVIGALATIFEYSAYMRKQKTVFSDEIPLIRLCDRCRIFLSRLYVAFEEFVGLATCGGSRVLGLLEQIWFKKRPPGVHILIPREAGHPSAVQSQQDKMKMLCENFLESIKAEVLTEACRSQVDSRQQSVPMCMVDAPQEIQHDGFHGDGNSVGNEIIIEFAQANGEPVVGGNVDPLNDSGNNDEVLHDVVPLSDNEDGYSSTASVVGLKAKSAELKMKRKNKFQSVVQKYMKAVRTKVGVVEYLCSFCPTQFRSKSALYQHLRRIRKCRRKMMEEEEKMETIVGGITIIHDDPPPQDLVVPPEAAFEVEAETSNDIAPKPSTSVSPGVTTRRSARMAKRKVKQEKTEEEESEPPVSVSKYQCDACGKLFSGRAILRDHKMLVHQKIRPFVCTKCGKAYSRELFLKVHTCKPCTPDVDEFLGVRCGVCNLNFPSALDAMANLETHVEEKHSDSKVPFYKCAKCPGRYHRVVSLKRHMKVEHPSGRQFSCSICGQAYLTRRTLQGHLRRHQLRLTPAEKHIPCPDCGKKFSCAEYMKRHQKIHAEGEGPFQCDNCKRRFKVRDYLRQHLYKTMTCRNAAKNEVKTGDTNDESATTGESEEDSMLENVATAAKQR